MGQRQSVQGQQGSAGQNQEEAVFRQGGGLGRG
jgi:hypothetical protein